MTVAAKNLFARMLDRLERRFRAARPGSVLILVVALLVLMALIGTAYIATARSDRYASAQHIRNNQIDLLADGVVNMVMGVIADDLKDQLLGTYRPPADNSGSNSTEPTPNGYDHYDF